MEYDPFDYYDFSASNRLDAKKSIRDKDSNINFGTSYQYNDNVTIDVSYIKGNTFNLSFNYSYTFDEKSVNKPTFKPLIETKSIKSNDKNSFYKDILINLNQNKLFLQTANIDKKGNLDISISTSDHRNAIRSSSYAAHIAKKVADINQIDLSLINISHINAGIELNNISYTSESFDEKSNTPLEVNIRNTKLSSGDPNGYLKMNSNHTLSFL